MKNITTYAASLFGAILQYSWDKKRRTTPYKAWDATHKPRHFATEAEALDYLGTTNVKRIGFKEAQ